MAVNRHKQHLIVLPEDDAYLTLVNGIRHKALQTNLNAKQKEYKN